MDQYQKKISAVKMRGICFILSMLIVNVMSECFNFTCVRENEKQVNFTGLVLDCPKDKYCNQLAKAKDEESCALPCVDLPCGSLFKCNDKDKTAVEIGGVNFKCEDGFVCKYTNNPDCMPCVPGNCDDFERGYECIPGNEKKFKLGEGIIGECQGDLVCNKDFEPPCKKPCIKGKSASGSTTTTTITTTIATATTPVNEQPCTSNRTSNCIEGQRGLYYYRCRSYLNGTIASNLRSCEDINFDVVCYKSGVC